MGAAVAIGAMIGAMTSAAVHGFRGGSGNGAFLAMLGGAAGGAVGGYAGPALGGMAGLSGGAVGGGLAGTGVTMSQLISAGGKIAAGMLMPDYYDPQSQPNWEYTFSGVGNPGGYEGSVNFSKGTPRWSDGTKWTQQDYDNYFRSALLADTYTGRAMAQVEQGSGPDGTITIGDAMRAVDPTGQAPTEGEMTEERWDAISPIYGENLMGTLLGTGSNRQVDRLLNQAREGIPGDELVGQPYFYGLPLVQNEDGNWTLPSPRSGIGSKLEDLFYEKSDSFHNQFSDTDTSAEVDLLEKPSEEEYFSTDPVDNVDVPTPPESKVNYARQQARYNSFAAARASEDALRAQALLQTSKSLNLPRFDEEYNSASKRFTQKPKPFS